MKNSNEGIALRQFVEDYKNKEWIFYTKDNWKTYNIWKDSNDFALWSEEYDTTTSYALYYDEYTRETQAKRNKHTFIVSKRFLKTSTASDKKRIYFVRTGTREI